MDTCNDAILTPTLFSAWGLTRAVTGDGEVFWFDFKLSQFYSMSTYLLGWYSVLIAFIQESGEMYICLTLICVLNEAYILCMLASDVTSKIKCELCRRFALFVNPSRYFHVSQASISLKNVDPMKYQGIPHKQQVQVSDPPLPAAPATVNNITTPQRYHDKAAIGVSRQHSTPPPTKTKLQELALVGLPQQKQIWCKSCHLDAHRDYTGITVAQSFG